MKTFITFLIRKANAIALRMVPHPLWIRQMFTLNDADNVMARLEEPQS